MRGWSRWVASAIGAVGAGAGLAALERRRDRNRTPAAVAAVADAPVAAPEEVVEDDPQAALDAARDRLRKRADELRTRIEES